MSTKQISITSLHPYEMSGEVNENTEVVWILLHGYAQLASDFLKEFRILKTSKTALIAPQGLSRFYVRGFKGETGASWMTTEHRSMDITNYMTYLNAIYTHEVQPFADTAELSVLGFSQGSATASRWLVNAGIPFKKLILWAGFLAHEIGRESAQQHLKNRDIRIVYGEQDPFFTANVVSNLHRKIKALGIQPQMITFSGKHEINEIVLKQLM